MIYWEGDSMLIMKKKGKKGKKVMGIVLYTGKSEMR